MFSLIQRSEGAREYPIHLDAELGDEQLKPCDETMDERSLRFLDPQSGKIGWALLWLLGIPLPVLLIAYLIWGR